MSFTGPIYNEDGAIFQFDTYESPGSSTRRLTPQMSDAEDFVVLSPQDPSPISEELGEQSVIEEDAKGKGVTKPMPIRASDIVHDLFDMPPSGTPYSSGRLDIGASTSVSSTFSPSSFSFGSPSFDSSYLHGQLSSSSRGETDRSRSPFVQGSSAHSHKGKAKEGLTILPPLTFSLPTFSSAWPALDHTPPTVSTYGPIFNPSSTISAVLNPAQNVDTYFPVTQPDPCETGMTSRPLPRSHSLSTLTPQANTLLTSSMPKNKLKIKPSRSAANLARKLFSGKHTDSNTSVIPQTPDIESLDALVVDSLDIQGSCFSWYTKPQAPTSGSELRPTTPSYFFPTAAQDPASYYPHNRVLLKCKGRSNSSPFPFSALDYVPVTSPDIFVPLPIYNKIHFDKVVPREIQLHILRAFVEVHEHDHLRAVEEGRWTVAKASSLKGQWVGRAKGLKELFKLSMVSKSWQGLVYDGQLWTDLDISSFSNIPRSVLMRLAKRGGSFITSLNFAGYAQLHTSDLKELADNLCLSTSRESLTFTRLTVLNLQGCSELTTDSLHYMLMSSRLLESLSVKGLKCVNNETCNIIGTFCCRITSLNMNRCLSMDGSGIRALAQAALARDDILELKELRLCGLRYASDSMMEALGKAAPNLEVLDLSYSRQLHNSALDKFVACPLEGHDPSVDTVVLMSRELGRESHDVAKYRRRLTRIRHLSVSFCLLLTDTVCSNLAYSVPCLEFLEMAGIGSELKDEGLVRLLNTTPHIRRIDLEDAVDITDSFLDAITPQPEEPNPRSVAPHSSFQPGHALEQLIISYATHITDDALLSLIRNCTRLKVLEADNTRMGSAVFREFIRLSRERTALNAKIVAIDCRGIGESLVKDLVSCTRPRRGWRSYTARKLMYLDGRDKNEEDLKIGQDECDESRVVVKTFYSWQTVDAVKTAREKRRKATSRRVANESFGSEYDEFGGRTTSTRWWSPGGRRSGNSSPSNLQDLASEGCRTM